MSQQLNKGFIYVASKNKLYYEFAILSCESLKTFYPDSHVTLFTHKNFLDSRSSMFDNIVTDIPIHTRAKMWCMARTPYDTTFYNDVDSYIVHPNIKKVFDELGDADMFFTKPVLYGVGNYDYYYIDHQRKIPPPYHGGACCYKKSELSIDFMQTWFDEYVKQFNSPWPYTNVNTVWRNFDMFTLWRMTCGEFSEFDRFKELNIKIGSLVYGANLLYQEKEYGKKPIVNLQIDKTSLEKFSHWKDIEKRLKDERVNPKKQNDDPFVIEYN